MANADSHKPHPLSLKYDQRNMTGHLALHELSRPRRVSRPCHLDAGYYPAQLDVAAPEPDQSQQDADVIEERGKRKARQRLE